MNNYIEFTPKYSPKFQAKHLDNLDFQMSGTDEDVSLECIMAAPKSLKTKTK